MAACGVNPISSHPSPDGVLSRKQRRDIVAAYARPSDVIGAVQVLNTLVPLGLMWAMLGGPQGAPAWLVLGTTLAMSLFLLRVFVLMHDCGHNSLFRTPSLNKAFGFLLGVVSGMPQYVWSKNHAYHHSTNGDWSKYSGPMNIITVDEYLARTDLDRRSYRRARSIAIAPIAGFAYLILNPRLTWIRGSAQLLRHVVRGKLAEPGVSLAAHAASFQTRLWTSRKEYRHMTWNNVAVLATWAAMSWLVGPALFFGVYFVAIALAGGGALVLFTVQHNFEHSYASETKDWDHDDAALHGTSLLLLPAWLNWFTADIAYHHAHHLSASIPNYRLARCHAECAHLFTEVTRLRLSQVPAALRCILWDKRARRIVSVSEVAAGLSPGTA
jgi:omega-6 fatty acid desaturase (delta-12 desaturase)